MVLKGNQNFAGDSGSLTMMKPDQIAAAATHNKAKKRNHESAQAKVYYNSSRDVTAECRDVTAAVGGSPQPLKPGARHSPSRSSPPAKMMMAGQSSPGPGLAYAGAKFSEPPSPGALPRPPPSWFGAGAGAIMGGGPPEFRSAPAPTAAPIPCYLESRRCSDISDRLKVLLKVRA